MISLTLTGFDNQFFDSGDWDTLNTSITHYLDDILIEFAFLMYPKKYGLQRYPDIYTIYEMVDNSKAYNNALHICGNELIYEFLTKYKQNLWLYEHFDRIQLNADWTDKYLYKMFLTADIEKPIILQYNEINAPIFDESSTNQNVCYLIDESRGNGKLGNIAYWKNKWEKLTALGYSVGFAGGINLQNIVSHINLLKSWDANINTWIDMESGCRNEQNEMDLITVLELIHLYVSHHRCVGHICQ